MSDHSVILDLLRELLPIVQTIVALTLGYIAKTMHDINIRLARAEQRMEDLEKMWLQILDGLTRRMDRIENR